MTEGAFFQDLAVVMSVAGLAALLFSRLGWPKALGYILAGVMMNGYTWGGAFLKDVGSISTIGQLGIVFLMFSMGLGFSASEMKAVKNVTIPTALLDTIVMTWLGYMVGTRVFGWGLVPSLFLGVAICDSATTLLAKVIGEMGWSNRPFVRLTIGTSVCEDVVCVGLLALITGIAKGSGMSFGAVGLSMGGLFVFFLGVVVFGFVLVPRLVAAVSRSKDTEALLVTVLGLCFFISYVAYRLEYSLALGAFLVGVIGSSCDNRRRLNEIVSPLKTMFAAMFFVSVGLLVDPFVCLRHLPAVLLVTAVVIVGKFVNCTLGALLAGERLGTAVSIGLSLAQIGEFAFMVAMLYVGVTGDTACPIFPVAVGASLLTTVLNPFFIRLSDRVSDRVEEMCPPHVAKRLSTYRAFLARIRATSPGGRLHRLIRRCVVELLFVALVDFAAAMVLVAGVRIDWSRFSVLFERYDTYICVIVADFFILASCTFVVPVARRLASALVEATVGTCDQIWQQAIRPLVALTTYAAVAAVFFVEMIMLNVLIMPTNDIVFNASMLVVLLVGGVFGWKRFAKAGAHARKLFDDALTVDARLANIENVISVQIPASEIRRLTVASDSPAVGETVVSLDIRARTGASVVSVSRDGRVNRHIGPDWVFAAGDEVVAMGDAEQLSAFEALLVRPVVNESATDVDA